MNQRAIDDLRRLAAQDDGLAEREGTLRDLDDSVREIRHRAEECESFSAGYGEMERRVGAAIDAAEAEVARRGQELTAAEVALAAEHDEERRELARRAHVRAADHLEVAEAALERARADAVQLEQAAGQWQLELPKLEERALRLAAELPGVQMPGPDARALVEWASHAHAALFVAVRQVEAERERVIREGNELASTLLGEPTYGSTVAQALVRVETVTR